MNGALLYYAHLSRKGSVYEGTSKSMERFAANEITKREGMDIAVQWQDSNAYKKLF